MAVNYQYSGPEIASNGLVLYLDAASPNSYNLSRPTVFKDVSRNNNNATLINGPVYNSNNGGSLIFDGTNDYANIPYNSILNGSTAFTIDFWFNSNSISSEQMIFSTTNSLETAGYHIEIYLSKLMLQVYPSKSFTFSTAVLLSNTFYNVSISYNLGSVKYYVNGTSKGTANYTYTPSNIDVAIAKFSKSNSLYFQGNLPSLKFYNRDLSESEILQNFNVTKGRFGI